MKVLQQSNQEVPFSIKQAHAFALERHKGQYRKFTKEPYIRHPEQVVCILAMFGIEEDLLSAAMLHDIVEDTYTTIQEIYEIFGDRVGELVRELTVDESKKKLLGKKIYMVDHINAMSDDAFTIKLADRLHNVMGLLDSRMKNDFVKWYWVETMFILNNLDRSRYTKVHNQLLDLLDFITDYIEITKQI